MRGYLANQGNSRSSSRSRPALARYWVPIGVLRDKLYFIYGKFYCNKFYIWRDKFSIFKQVFYFQTCFIYGVTSFIFFSKFYV